MAQGSNTRELRSADRGWRVGLLPLLGPLIILIIWQLLWTAGLVEPSLVSSPAKTFATMLQLALTGPLWLDVRATLARMFTGYLLAGLVGVTLGLLLGVFRPAYEMFAGVVDFFRSTPVTTLYPVFVLTFGIGHASKIAMVFWASIFVILLNSAYGAIQAGRLRSQMARLYGATPLQVFRWVVFFDALPQTMIGLRVAVSYALIVEILCEMFMGSQNGLGQRIIEAYTRYSMENLYALILVTGTLGYVLNRLFVVIERRIVPWVQK